MKYSIVVQAGPDEILGAEIPEELNLVQISSHMSVEDLIVALPEMEGSEQAASRLEEWGYKCFIGDTYNVCSRMLQAQAFLEPQNFVVRVLAIWRHIDLEYVDRLVNEMKAGKWDLLIAPKDFDFTMAADVASIESLQEISQIKPQSAQEKRALFNPWGYMECNPEKYKIYHLEPAPKYPSGMVGDILKERRKHPEREFFGRGYEGSRYHFLAPHIADGQKILDMACGSGFGSAMLAETAEHVVGVDYDESAIKVARERFGGEDELEYRAADAQSFRYDEPEYFDLVISFHTLEHVPDDKAMMRSLYANLKPGGRLVVEVPLLAKRPLGVPINPYHLREYQVEEVELLLDDVGLHIIKMFGVCRGMYVSKDLARDAIHVWATKEPLKNSEVPRHTDVPPKSVAVSD